LLSNRSLAYSCHMLRQAMTTLSVDTGLLMLLLGE
jgi:hypothetical protein